MVVTSNALRIQSKCSDANMGVGTIPTNIMIDPNPMMTTDQIKKAKQQFRVCIMAFTFKGLQAYTNERKERDQAAPQTIKPPSQAVRAGGGGKGSTKDIKFADENLQKQRDRS